MGHVTNHRHQQIGHTQQPAKHLHDQNRRAGTSISAGGLASKMPTGPVSSPYELWSRGFSRWSDDTTGHLQKILAQIGSFCLVSIGLFVLLEIVILYPRFKYSYRRGLDNILVLLIGGIPIVMHTVLSITLAVGAQQLAKHKALVTRITAAYASRAENQDVIDRCVVGALDNPTRARAGIKLLDFKPFNPVDKRTEVTYREESSGKLKRVTKRMTVSSSNSAPATRPRKSRTSSRLMLPSLLTGLRALAVAYEELDHDSFEGEGNGFELIGLLAIFDPPRDNTKQTIGGATNAARGAAGIVLTEPGLSTIVHTIRGSRQIF